tara:strand:+ start:89 stop:835 length:747 start_codon:yes stop_codon:yes gene_type:complete
MLKICTVYFEGIYTPDYVSKLYRSLKRNSKVPFEFICLSDTDVEADLVLPLKHNSIKRHWHKLKFFSPNFAYQEPDDDIIIMDIDQVVVGDVEKILNHPVHSKELITYDAWWNTDYHDLPINGSFYKFKSGSLNFVWDRFISNPEYWQLFYYNEGVVHKKYYGEQNYVYQCMLDKKIDITKLPGKWLGLHHSDYKKNLEIQKIYCDKFKADYMIMGDTHKYVKVVNFAGPGKTIHENNEKFIKDNWYD